MSDLHSGSAFSLCTSRIKIDPPKPIDGKITRGDQLVYDAKLHLQDVRDQFHREFKKHIAAMPDLDYMFIGGDCVEGVQRKSGGASLLTRDINDQCDISTQVIDRARKGDPVMFGVLGTEYHVTDAEGGAEHERKVYTRFKRMEAFDDVIFAKVNGIIIRMQHFVGRSGTPYGKQGPVTRQIVQNTLSVAMGREHDADFCMFGHVHYSVGTGFPMSRKWAITLPCLKLRGESYGRRFNDSYDVGMILLEFRHHGEMPIIHPMKIKVNEQMPELHEV